MNKIKETYEYITEAIVSLHEGFMKNHKLKMKDSNVWIGRSNSLSYLFERSLATKLSEKFPEYLYLVDYPITMYSKEAKTLGTIYQDIMIISGIDKEGKEKQGKIIAILDLKIDLGFLDIDYYGLKKNEHGYILSAETETKFIKREKKINESEFCKFNYIVGGYSKKEKEINKEKGKLRADFKQPYKKISIVCTEKNDHNRKIMYEKLMRIKGYELLYLLKDIHPNSFENETNEIKKEISNKREKINLIFDFLDNEMKQKLIV